jgi:hypothetical protein
MPYFATHPRVWSRYCLRSAIWAENVKAISWSKRMGAKERPKSVRPKGNQCEKVNSGAAAVLNPPLRLCRLTRCRSVALPSRTLPCCCHHGLPLSLRLPPLALFCCRHILPVTATAHSVSFVPSAHPLVLAPLPPWAHPCHRSPCHGHPLACSRLTSH